MPTHQTERAPRAAPLPPDERRAAIIEAVLPILAEHGDSTTSRQLAAAAGVSEGTIFKVFADKDDLFAAALERALDPAPLTDAIMAIDHSQTVEEQLIQAVELIQHRVVDVWQLLSRLKSQHRHPERPTPLSDHPALTALMQNAHTELRIEPDRAATILRSLTLSLTHPMLVAEALPAAEIVDVFLRGVGQVHA